MLCKECYAGFVQLPAFRMQAIDRLEAVFPFSSAVTQHQPSLPVKTILGNRRHWVNLEKSLQVQIH